MEASDGHYVLPLLKRQYFLVLIRWNHARSPPSYSRLASPTMLREALDDLRGGVRFCAPSTAHFECSGPPGSCENHQWRGEDN
eukprot:6219305-Amphidinium_carterae.2